MSEEILKSSITKLKMMSLEKRIDYKLIYHILENLKNLKIIDEPVFLLFELLVRQNYNQNNVIDALNITPEKSKRCINCNNNEFIIWTVIVKPAGGHSSATKVGQSAGDLHMQVCTKCKFCHFTKPDYWS